jgi:hypothetical protein
MVVVVVVVVFLVWGSFWRDTVGPVTLKVYYVLTFMFRNFHLLKMIISVCIGYGSSSQQLRHCENYIALIHQILIR